MNKVYLTSLLNNSIIPSQIACSSDQYHGELRQAILEAIEANHPRKEYLKAQLSALDKMYGATPKSSVTVTAGE